MLRKEWCESHVERLQSIVAKTWSVHHKVQMQIRALSLIQDHFRQVIKFSVLCCVSSAVSYWNNNSSELEKLVLLEPLEVCLEREALA